ncbi:hypothetical protein Bca52824_026965 [Brassica carinata]|uniref:Uncharacterized protein n=1 Tax=Brassica carinata TaxID=52824 RepID=A0A8X7V9F2_BRACI|nr:hypothetical protein Bca52824_026965 [Brassica carinata]
MSKHFNMKICVHVQTHDGSVMKLYLWNKAAPTSARNSNHMEAPQTLSSNSYIANRIAAEVVTKPETVTLEELFSYMKQEASKSNEGVGADHCVPVPQALLDTIGQIRKFIVKVSDHNLTGKTQTITITKILPPEAPLPATSDGVSKTGGEESGPSGGFGDSAGDRARKAAESLESDETKRSKNG